MRFPWIVAALILVAVPPVIHGDGAGAPPAYWLIRDKMDTIIEVAVPADITEIELREKMRQAANDHQDDPARDYLMASYLTVRAFLTSGPCLADEPAGRLLRFVPWENAEERARKRGTHPEVEHVEVTLELSRRSLEPCRSGQLDAPQP